MLPTASGKLCYVVLLKVKSNLVYVSSPCLSTALEQLCCSGIVATPVLLLPPPTGFGSTCSISLAVNGGFLTLLQVREQNLLLPLSPEELKTRAMKTADLKMPD